MTILVTGVAGFIGHALAKQLLDEGLHVVGIDNLNDYYDVNLKHLRLDELTPHPHFTFHHVDLVESDDVMSLMSQIRPLYVVHLAAQAGVRFSLEQPRQYIDANIVGTFNLLEACRQFPVEHALFASSSSVYGQRAHTAFKESDSTDRPASLYAASKKSVEAMAASYSALYHIPISALRFFTVYGPFGRPDMAPFKFAKAIMNGDTIDVYNHGKMQRDFTFISDITTAMSCLLRHPPSQKQQHFDVFNIGRGKPVGLMTFIELLENALGKKANKRFLPMQAGDVVTTFADCTKLSEKINLKPIINLEEGIGKFADWYASYSKI